MTIQINSVVTYRFKMFDSEGNLLDESKDIPNVYLHGYQLMLPLIENNLMGKKVGDTISVSIPPEKGYGLIDPELIRSLPRNRFLQSDALQLGMSVYSEKKPKLGMKIVSIDENSITVDANHPLAGKTLIFEIEILSIRDATPEEIANKKVDG